MDNTRLPNTPSTTNLEKEEIVSDPGNDGNASMPEQVKRPNPCRKMMMMREDMVHHLYFPILYNVLIVL